MIDNNEIEKRLASALNAAAPDMLDDLMAELDLNENTEPSMREKLAENEQDRYKRVTARSKGVRRLVSLAAVFVVMIGVFTVWRNANQSVLAVVDLDVNPSIELSINGKEKVVGAIAVNEDGEAILSDMDLKGSDVKTACNAVVGYMLMKGYLNDQSNSILLSVSANDSNKGLEIENELSNCIGSYMDKSNVASSVLGQYVEDDDELRTFAEKNGISAGKAKLIRRILETNGRKMTEDSLLGLTTQELIVLAQERNVQSETVYGKADTGSYIGQEAALAAALAHAGMDISQVTDTEVEMDCENGVIIYEVEFDTGGIEYEFDINASTGEVINSGRDAKDYDDDHDDNHDDDDDDWDDDD